VLAQLRKAAADLLRRRQAGGSASQDAGFKSELAAVLAQLQQAAGLPSVPSMPLMPPAAAADPALRAEGDSQENACSNAGGAAKQAAPAASVADLAALKQSILAELRNEIFAAGALQIPARS